MSESLRDLVEDLASVSEGQPALVLVDNYRERERLAKDLTEEADLYGIQVIVPSTPEDAQQQVSAGNGNGARAAVILIDAGAADAWGPWLEANREALPQWVRFVVVLMMPADVPVLSRLAPAFMSWAKGLEIRKLDVPGGIPSDDVDAELAQLEKETGMSADAFVDAWRRGDVPDTFRNTTWLNLAWAASRREPR